VKVRVMSYLLVRLRLFSLITDYGLVIYPLAYVQSKAKLFLRMVDD